MRTITTDQINEILAKQQRGEKITRTENFQYQGIKGTLKSKITFVYTNSELQEIYKCANDPVYFIENYCQLQGDDGSTKNIKLYGYQKEWINSYRTYRFLLQSISQQTGYNNVTACYYMWILCFKTNENILIIPSLLDNGKNLLNRIRNLYINLPYFIKPGLTTLNADTIALNNTNRIKVGLNNYGSNYDTLHLLDYKEDDSELLNIVIPTQSALKNSKLIIQGFPGESNTFKELFINAGRENGDPFKNKFQLNKTYWWEVPNHDMEWRQKCIDTITQENFDKFFDNRF